MKKEGHGIMDMKPHVGFDEDDLAMAEMKDGTYRLAQIVSNINNESFYVHFLEFNRRMDRKVTKAQIRIDEGEIMREKMEIEAREKEEPTPKVFENDEHAGLDTTALKAHENATKFKTIEQIEMGDYSCETWYYSPYPVGYHQLSILYICEYCLSFYVQQEELIHHSHRCELSHPPGDEIYRDEQKHISVFEIDATYERIYCENLCLMSKLFLDHKTLYYETDPFLFYVLTEYDEYGYHFVGYFSKEKHSEKGYNLACILVLPFHQRKGYGKTGSPETPLSDLGFLTYISWWTQQIVECLRKNESMAEISINELATSTGIRQQDVQMVMERLNILRYVGGQHYIIAEPSTLDEIYKKAGRPGIPVITEKLHFTPYTFNYEPKY